MIRGSRHIFVIALMGLCVTLYAQSSYESRKMSSLVREAARSTSMRKTAGYEEEAAPHICALVRIAGHTDDVQTLLTENDSRALAQWGDIYIADIPIRHLNHLAAIPNVKRIEANEPCSILIDTTAVKLSVKTVWEGTPQTPAFDGTGVVMGIQDIGFDLTHPTFYSRDFNRYRIQRLWDFLSNDTINSTMYVGQEYTDESSLLTLQHSADDLHHTHGTHTAGIAAGSGAEGPNAVSSFIGMAPEADLCLVANATSNNSDLIDEKQRYKFTSALDLLGFQYIFDYAESVGKPCVISFSQGFRSSMYSEDQLYFEVLDQMVGPGRIIVAAAGNEGREKTYLHKKASDSQAGTFINSERTYFLSSLRSYDEKKNINIRLKFYPSGNEFPITYTLSSQQAYDAPDSVYSDTITIAEGKRFLVYLCAYPNFYEPQQTAYELLISHMDKGKVGDKELPISVELMGDGTEIEMFKYIGNMTTNSLDPTLNNATNGHSIHAPSCSPSVISVGVTIYRTGVTNYLGEWKHVEEGTNGERCTMSSIGPTLSGLIKPDVMAPGCNVVSSYSTWYLQEHPDANDIKWDVRHFNYQGRTYPWNSNSGTSMSAPVVGGIIALWLQANPQLTPQEIKDVIAATSRHYDPTLSYPNNFYGHGEIDAYKGLLYVLDLKETGIIDTHQPRQANMSLKGNNLCLHFEHPTTSSTRLHVYHLSGQKVHEAILPIGQSTYTVPLPALGSGIYAIQIDTNDPNTTGSSLIRIR